VRTALLKFQPFQLLPVLVLGQQAMELLGRNGAAEEPALPKMGCALGEK